MAWRIPQRTLWPVSYTHLDVYKRQTLANADSVLQSMAEVTRQLEEADLTGILDNLDRTLNEGQQSLQDASKALEKVSQIDFDSLNQAIRDLRQLLDNPLKAIFS